MKRHAGAGYTILEAMIFLAVSALLFVSAVTAIGGNQEQVQYAQAVRDFETQMKDVINDVTNGYYPEYEQGKCLVAVGSGNLVIDTGSGSPGTSESCMNIGKNVMFNLEDENFGVGTIVGAAPELGSAPNLSLSVLTPTLAYQEAGQNQIDLTTYKPIRYGAQVTKIGSEDFPDNEYSSLNFVSDFTTSGVSSGSRVDGVLTVSVYGIIGTLGSNVDIGDYKDDIETLATNASDSSEVTMNPTGGFYVCLAMPDDRLARVLVGLDGVVTATATEFDLDPEGVCAV